MRWAALALALAACRPAPKASDLADAAAVTADITPSPAPPARKEEPRSLRVIMATQDTDALSLVRTKRLEAKARGSVLVVYVSATWCEPCKRFKSELESGRLDARLGKLTLLAFDADRDAERLAAAGYTFKFVPFVALPGADGHPADTQQATGHGGEAWRELLAKLDAWGA